MEQSLPDAGGLPGPESGPAAAVAQPVFLVFEGGGAKGLVHLGALHAVEAAKASGALEVKGHAGTSAGAMVATLAAVGYRAEELFDRDARPVRGGICAAIGRRLSGLSRPPRQPVSRLLDALCLDRATDLFGPGGWAWLWLFRLVTSHAALFLAAPLMLVPLGGLGALLGWSGGTVAALVLGPPAWAGLLLAWMVRGVVGLDAVARHFDKALRESRKLSDRKLGRRPTFRDLQAADVCLKLCATNLTRRRLEVFSFETSPDVPVSDAVCASICYPMAFRPWRIQRADRRHPDGRPAIVEELHLDGGMLSNLPAWCLDEERRIDPRVMTLAWAIQEPPGPPPSGWTWPLSILRTVLFGGQVLSLRGAGPIEVLDQRTRVGVLDFDISATDARLTVEQAHDFAADLLEWHVTKQPGRLRLQAAFVREAVAQRLGVPLADIRVSYAVAEDHLAGGLRDAPLGSDLVRTLSLRHGAGFEGWADDGLVVPVDGSVAGAAWRTGQVQMQFLRPGGASGLSPMLRARLRPGLTWVLAIPIEEALNPKQTNGLVGAILAIDGVNEPPDEDSFVEIMATLTEQTILPRFGAKR